jgi:hypothetical protein
VLSNQTVVAERGYGYEFHFSVPRISFHSGADRRQKADPKQSASRNHTSGRQDHISAVPVFRRRIPPTGG